MIWESYTAEVMSWLPDYCLIRQDIWRTHAPLICFNVVEWHFPDHVTRQFGLVQRIPQSCDTSRALHAINRRGRSGRDWTAINQVYIDIRAHRWDTLVTGDLTTAPMDPTDPYILWYCRITRRLVAPPIARPTIGFQSVGSIIELLEETFRRIYHTSCSTYAGSSNLTLCMDTLGRITDLSSSCLTSIREQRRLVNAPVSTADVPSTSVEPPPSSVYTTHIFSAPSSTFVRPPPLSPAQAPTLTPALVVPAPTPTPTPTQTDDNL